MKHGDLNKFIKYDTKVTNVTFDEEKKTFLVQTTSADNIGTPHTEETFDYVIVATGHFWAPNFPEFPGIDKFPGRVLHAHDYKCAKEFKGQRIMVVGGSYSADDIAVQCMKFGAISAAISCRRPTGYCQLGHDVSSLILPKRWMGLKEIAVFWKLTFRGPTKIGCSFRRKSTS